VTPGSRRGWFGLLFGYAILTGAVACELNEPAPNEASRASSRECPQPSNLESIRSADESKVVATARRYVRATHDPHFGARTIWVLSDHWWREANDWSSPQDVRGSESGGPFKADPLGFVSDYAQPIASRNGNLDPTEARDFLLARVGVSPTECDALLRSQIAEATWYVVHGCRDCTLAYALVIHRSSGFKILGA
jgi:hypothetical protein